MFEGYRAWLLSECSAMLLRTCMYTEGDQARPVGVLSC